VIHQKKLEKASTSGKIVPAAAKSTTTTKGLSPNTKALTPDEVKPLKKSPSINTPSPKAPAPNLGAVPNFKAPKPGDVSPRISDENFLRNFVAEPVKHPVNADVALEDQKREFEVKIKREEEERKKKIEDEIKHRLEEEKERMRREEDERKRKQEEDSRRLEAELRRKMEEDEKRIREEQMKKFQKEQEELKKKLDEEQRIFKEKEEKRLALETFNATLPGLEKQIVELAKKKVALEEGLSSYSPLQLQQHITTYLGELNHQTQALITLVNSVKRFAKENNISP